MNDLQRTDDWYLLRKGKITASEIEQVMHKGKKDVFSTGCISYLKQAVAEQYMTDDAFLEEKQNEPTPYACKWGTFWEDKAREVYCEKTGNMILDAPFIPMIGFEAMAGGSPDGIIANNGGISGANGIIEIKCPKNTAIHLEHYMYQTAEDLRADNPQYFAQVQMNMMIASDYTGAPITYCDFVSYDPRVIDAMQLKVLCVLPDAEYQQELRERIALAIDWINAYKQRIEGK